MYHLLSEQTLTRIVVDLAIAVTDKRPGAAHDAKTAINGTFAALTTVYRNGDGNSPLGVWHETQFWPMLCQQCDTPHIADEIVCAWISDYEYQNGW